MKTKTQK